MIIDFALINEALKANDLFYLSQYRHELCDNCIWNAGCFGVLPSIQYLYYLGINMEIPFRLSIRDRHNDVVDWFLSIDHPLSKYSLYYAGNDMNLFHKLIQAGANVNTVAQNGGKQNGGYNPFLTACNCGYKDAVIQLYIHGANINYVHCSSSGLTLAITNKNIEIASLLLDWGATQLINGEYPLLHIACSRNDIEMVKLLLKYNPPIVKLWGRLPQDNTTNQEIVDLINSYSKLLLIENPIVY